jgi:OOP family OmpA-OmpF porin
MIRQRAYAIPLVAFLAFVSTLPACRVQMGAKAGDDPKPAEPAPAPAPTPEPAPAPAPTPEPAPTPPPVSAPAPAGKVEQKGGSIRLPGAIVFDTDQATLKPGSGSEAVLDQLKAFLDENSKKIAAIRIEGHTDNQGTPEHNMDLSGRRALTIKKYLIDHGTPADKLLAVGFGQTKPVAPNTTEDGKAQNRRTEFKIAMTYDKNGKPVKYLGGDPLGGGQEFK